MRTGELPADLTDVEIIIQARLAHGTLRHDPCIGGVVVVRGSQRSCNGCERILGADDIEMHAQFPDGDLLRFHAKCFGAWCQATHS